MTYIKKQDALDTLLKGTIIPDDWYTMGIMAALDWAIKTIADMPTIDAEVVTRCKDCHYSQEDDFDGSLWCHNGFNEREVDEMHFCGYAEPKARDEE